MNESEARVLLMVRAVELGDEKGSLLSSEDRTYATLTARRAVDPRSPGSENDRVPARERYLLQRAHLLHERLERRQPYLAKVSHIPVWPSWISWMVPLAGLFLGLSASELTSDRRINLIAFPVAGMLAWNITVYVALALRLLLQKNHTRLSTGWIQRLVMKIGKWNKPLPQDQDAVATRSAAQFLNEWGNLVQPLHAHRLKMLLNLAAALFAAGIIGGMYLSALALEYRAGWESTFLTESGLHRILTFVLGPASAVTGIGIPGPEELRLLRWGAGQSGESGARWIHLYAVTTALFIVLPRVVIAAVHAYHARSLQKHFPVVLERDPYFRRLLAQLEGLTVTVEVIPYSYHLDAAAQGALERANQAAFGDGTRTNFLQNVAYGGEDDFLEAWAETLASPDRLPDRLLILFNMTATPEAENHGALADGLWRKLKKLGEDKRLVIVVDVSPYRRKVMERGGQDRLASRRAAWNDMLKMIDLHAAFVDLETDAPEKIAESMDAAGTTALISAADKEPLPS